MDAFWVSAITALVTGVVVPIVAELIRRWKPKSEIQLNVTQAAKELIEGGDKAIDSVIKLLERYEKIMEEQNEKIAKQNAEIDSLKATLVSVQIDEDSARKRLVARIEAQEAYIKLLVELLTKYVPKTDIPPMPEILTESQKMKAIPKK